MLKLYTMPDGSMFQYEEGTQPTCAVEYDQKAVEKPANKAVEPENKSKKVSKK